MVVRHAVARPDLILIHVLPAGHCHAGLSVSQPPASQSATASVLTLQVVNLLLLSLGSPPAHSSLSLQTEIWREECKDDKMLGHCLDLNG